jgi:hypothetical protein
MRGLEKSGFDTWWLAFAVAALVEGVLFGFVWYLGGRC